MKSRMWRCVAYAVLMVFTINTSSNACEEQFLLDTNIEKTDFKSNPIATSYGPEGDCVVSELWRLRPNIEESVFSVICEGLSQIQDWEDFNDFLVHRLIELKGSRTVEVWKEHFGKHAVSTSILDARKNLKDGRFYMAKYKIEKPIENPHKALDTTVILNGEDPIKLVMDFFRRSRPKLFVKGGRIFLFSTVDFYLPSDSYEYLIAIEGDPGTPLNEGILRLVPRAEAEKATLFGCLELTCFDHGSLLRNPGTLFFGRL